MELMLRLGADDYNEAMVCAAENGYCEIVELMLEKGADDYTEAMRYAAMGGHLDIVDFIQRWKTAHS
jgi:hypothetical protein